MRSLFFAARHGATQLNELGNYRGWSDGPDAELNEDGIQAAHEAGVYLKKLNQKFSKILCSPLKRALLTAAIIAEYLEIESLETDDRLLPLNVGDFAGQSKKEHPIQPFLKNKKKHFPNGESIDEFEKRQHSFAEHLLPIIESEKDADDPEILVVAHVSNVMFWWNVQTGANSDEYLGETTDIIEPGGIALIAEYTTIPIFKANRDSEDQAPGKEDVDTHAIKGEPGTGYESGNDGPFSCFNCEYYKDFGCGQKDMLAKSKRPRNAQGRVQVEPQACCEYVSRPSKK